ncbi:inosine/xanthosine triphosphatase [Bacillus taeanensis]|uniref:Probable inosine/xanthosine triphosphatase n=1 Tax=Bacillus taeanensis TaxID=273032 RepID=A0A366Y071_9BACI|nr:inosine/xanthosine triphosphatase [Bacillus taeanensis]RBW69561.1 inosine/xanthosine triphosphatase [Bacillus taeanensis]
MLNIAVGSKNPTKLKAVQSAFEKMGCEVQVTGIDVSSGVADQPFSDDETITGAINRAKAVMASGKFDYGFGLEGGIEETSFGMLLCNWGAVVNADGEINIGGGIRILLPESIAKGVRQGKELGTVIDEWTGKQNIAKKEGTIGILTKGHINRADMFEDTAICAFSKFLK